MSRPLNKKYFGNRNVGSASTTTDDNIGGEGVASLTVNTAGTYTSALPTVSFSGPTLPDGVTATGTVHGNALTAVATAAGTGYNLGNTLTQTTGGTGTMATWEVTGLTVVGITLNNGGTANDVNDEFTFATSGFATPIRVRVTAANAGVATAVEIVNGGVWTTGALPSNTIGMTMTQVVAGQDMNGQDLEVNFTAWGVGTVAVDEQGDYTAISSGAKATTVTPAGGTGATLTITYGVSGVVIDQKGSGYTNVADAAPTFSTGAAAGTSVLTTSSGVTNGMNAAGNQENAIIAYGYVDGGREIVDIIRQTNGKSYKIEGADGIVRSAKLVADEASDDGEMDINATDSGGGTYWVTKLSGRKATLVQSGSGPWEFADGASVPWTFEAAPRDVELQADYNVKIDNA